MKPPICIICHKKFVGENEGDLLYFKPSQEGREFEEKAKTGLKGHHPDSEWFCTKHAEIAVRFKDLEMNDALEKIRAGS